MLKSKSIGVLPVGKGNISASVLGNYTSSAVRSLTGVSDFKNLTQPPATINGYAVQAYDAIAGQNEWHPWGLTSCGKGEPVQVMWVGHAVAPARFRNVRVGVS